MSLLLLFPASIPIVALPVGQGFPPIMVVEPPRVVVSVEGSRPSIDVSLVRPSSTAETGQQ